MNNLKGCLLYSYGKKDFFEELLFLFQLSHLTLTVIDRQEPEELPAISAEEVEQINKQDTQYEITVLEEKLSQMKPNMAAIAEYRKKVRVSICNCK